MTKSWERVALLGALVLAFALRLYQLDAHGLWYDEAFTSWIIAKDWAGIFEFARAPKLEHPPLYYFMLHGWQLLSGASEFALRFFSLGFSLLSVALLYRFARHWFGAPLARWTMLMAALSPFGVVYAQEARMYTLALCVSILALDSFLLWLHGDGRAWWLYIAFTLLGLGIHYYAALLLVVENIWVWIVLRTDASRSDRRALLARWLVWNAALVTLTLGILVVAPGPRETLALVFSHPLFAGRNAEGLGRVLVDLLIGGVVIRPLALPDVAASSVLASTVTIGAVALWRSARRDLTAKLLVLLLLVPAIVAAAVPLIYSARYLFVIVPSLVISAATALHALQARRALFAGVLALVLAATAYGLGFNYQFAKSEYREMAAIVTHNAHADDALVLDGASQWPLVFYYLRGNWSQHYIPQDPEAAELSDIDARLRAIEQAHARIWLIAEQSALVDPANNASRWLALNAYPVMRQWFRNGNAVALYLSDQPSSSQIWDVQFGEWWRLERSALSANTVNAGDALALELVWSAVKAIPQSERLVVTLRLFDVQAHTVQERITPPCDGFCPVDDWLVGEPVSDRHSLLIPDGTPSGEYSLRLEVFDGRRKQSLALQGSPSGAEASLELARIQVRGTHGQQ